MSAVTVAEAGQIWCPMVRAVRWETNKGSDQGPEVARAIGGCNSGGKEVRNPASARCISDKCAMWRWAEGAPKPRQVLAKPGSTCEAEALTDGWQKPAGDFVFVPGVTTGEWEDRFSLHCSHWIETEESARARRTGYCGLAGHPGAA